MQISPIDQQWIHEYIAKPYLQGCALVEQAWIGTERCLSPNNLSLKNRVIYWLKGSVLMLPFINTIVWLFFQSFRHDKHLLAPYSPKNSTNPLFIEEIQVGL